MTVTLRRGAFLLLLVVATGCEASSYMHSEGEVYYRASVGVSQADAAWDTEGDLQGLDCTSQRTRFSHLAEWGYSYYYNLFARGDLGDSRCGNRTRSGIGDLDVGVRGRLNPYMNFRTWELAVTIPTSSRSSSARLGCGVFGASASVDRTDRYENGLSFGYGASAVAWQAPLAHQLRLQTQLGGPFAETAPNWGWSAGLTGELPLVDRPADPGAALDDCGTQARALRSGFDVRYRYSRGISLGCGLAATLAGEDVTRAREVSCSFSRLWE